MAASSPYQNNDYAAVSSFRPYQLPVNDIFKAITAQNRFWDEGALRVKSVYDNALGLSLVTDENRSIRDNYMKDAEKQLSKLSSMDLSDPSVQRQGINLFKPLLSDQDIVGEDYVVRGLNKELATGLSYRNKDGGKEYNPLSVENIQYEKQLLATGLNKRTGWRSLYQNMSTYTPQVDTAAELKKITDLVKAREIKTAELKGDEWYIEEISKKGVSKERILSAIDELGSPQLKAQMRVEGRNIFYKHLLSDPANVDAYYQQVASNLFDKKIQDVKNSKAELEYEQYKIPQNGDAGNTTKRNSYQRIIDDLKKSITDLETVQKPKYISEYKNLGNLDALSGNLSKVEQLWQSASIHELAPALAWESSSQELKPNNAKIAKENIKVAYQRISLGYANLREAKRHNLAQEKLGADRNEIELLKALKTAAGGGNGSTGTIDFVFGGDGEGVVSVVSGSTSNVSTPNESDIKKIGEEQRNSTLGKLDQFDENLRESAISNIISPNAWSRIQKNVDANIPIGQNHTLTDIEIEKAASLMKAYMDKNGKGTWGNTLDGWKTAVSRMTPSEFKRKMGDMMKEDSDLMADVSTKLFQETNDPNGQLKIAQMRAAANSNARTNLNISKNIFTQQLPALGNYANLFDNGGKVPLNDDNIRKAYEKGVASGQLQEYYRRGDFPWSSDVIVKNPKSYGGLTGIGKRVMSLENFKKEIRDRTDPIFYKMATETNTQSASVFYDNTPKGQAKKFQALQSIPNIAQYQNSDNKKDIEKVLNFISSRGKNFSGYQLESAKGEETLPTMKIVMDGLSGDDKDEWEKLQNVRIPVIVKDPSWSQKTSPSAEFRYPNAVIAMTSINNPEKGSITIENQTSGSDIEAAVSVKDVYRIVNGKKVDVKPIDIELAISRQWPGKTINTVASKDPEALSNLLAQIAIGIELQNKKEKEKTK